MSELVDYTMRIWVKDRRYKEGERLYGAYEYNEKDDKWMLEEKRFLESSIYPSPKYRIEVFKTWVVRRNLMSGEEYRERFDTPNCCSSSSETYWSM